MRRVRDVTCSPRRIADRGPNEGFIRDRLPEIKIPISISKIGDNNRKTQSINTVTENVSGQVTPKRRSPGNDPAGGAAEN